MIRESLSSHYDRALSALEARTCHSWKMTLDRSKIMTTAPTLGGSMTPQVIIQSAHGCRITDIDNNDYIDLSMGFGSNIIGHSPAVVQNAIIDQAHKGWNFGLTSDSQLKLADLIRQAGPANERILFCASGSEATAIAMRAARAYTNKDVIGVFGGAYHGVHDAALITADPEHPSKKAHVGLGIPDALDSTVEPLSYGSAEALQRIRDLKGQLAAVIVEPVQSSFPVVESGIWLKELETTCRECGVVIILDEVMTGFRLAFGGGQSKFGLSPDMVTYGKAMAGGLPAGAVAGRAEIMKVFERSNHGSSVFAGSAFAGNPLSVAASLATLSYLHENRESFYGSLEESSADLTDRLNAYWSSSNTPLHIIRNGSMLRMMLQHRATSNRNDASSNLGPIDDAFFVHLLGRGVALHASRSIYLSAAHTREDINIIVDAMIGSTEDCAADGLFRNL
jgi:glutamate-1-semialdehyde 2,1-aminomutase